MTFNWNMSHFYDFLLTDFSTYNLLQKSKIENFKKQQAIQSINFSKEMCGYLQHLWDPCRRIHTRGIVPVEEYQAYDKYNHQVPIKNSQQSLTSSNSTQTSHHQANIHLESIQSLVHKRFDIYL